MLKLTMAVLAIALAGTASAAGWKSLRVDASSEAAFEQSLGVFKEKLSPARRVVFGEALKDIWVKGTQEAVAARREYAAADYYRQIHGLGYEAVVTLADPTGDTAKARYVAALRQLRPRVVATGNGASNRPAPIGPHGEQVRGTVDSGPAYQHSLRTMGQ